MSKKLAVVAVFLFTAACASMKSDSGLGEAKVNVVQPQIEIVQLSRIPNAARHVTGGIPVQFAMRVTNRANHPIMIKRVNVVSMGEGAYNLVQSSHPFKLWIEPAEFGDVNFWTSANIDSATILGANGPVTIRATVSFDSTVGQFEETVVRQINAFGRAEVGQSDQ